MTLLLVRVAFAGIRSRLLASALTVAIASAAAATIVLALEVRSTGTEPWQRTFAAANGAHVLAVAPSQADAERLTALPGVVEAGEPVPRALTTLRRGARDERLLLVGLGDRTTVNAPVRTDGGALRDGGVVLERSLARAHGLDVGSMVRVGGVALPVVGLAIVPSQPRYPRSNPGLAWVTRPTFERIATDPTAWRWWEALRLDDPSAASAFTQRAAATLPPAALASGLAGFETWQAQRDAALLDAQPAQLVVTVFGVLLLVVAFVVVGILVGARASDQRRDVGLLKAVGFTPRLVGLALALESALLGAVASVVGFAVGALAAPRLTAPTADTLLGAPTVAASPWHLLIAMAVVSSVLLAGALSAGRRAANDTVVESLRSAEVGPPRSRLARAVARAPLPVVPALGLNALLARRRRALLTGTAVGLAAAMGVVALSLAATLAARPAGEPSDVPDELPALVYTLDAALLLVVLTTLAAVAGLAVRERIRELGILRAIGLTPRQVLSTLVAGQVVLAAAASLLAVPLGLGLYLALVTMASGTTEDVVLPSWWALASVPAATVLLAIAAVSLPARLALRARVAETLRYE